MPAAPTRLQERALGLIDFLHVDAESDALLDGLVLGLTDPATRLSAVAHGTATVPAWRILTDPAYAELWSLPTAGLWTGGVPPTRAEGENDDAYLARARAELAHPTTMGRGSVGTLEAVARSYLTGARYAKALMRLGGSDWEIGMVVIESEVTDLDALTAALNADHIITAGMRVTVSFHTPGGVWTLAELEDIYSDRSLADLEGDFATLTALETHTLA